jgi:hypothetical protein
MDARGAGHYPPVVGFDAKMTPLSESLSYTSCLLSLFPVLLLVRGTTTCQVGSMGDNHVT